jgi:hypothetical protein
MAIVRNIDIIMQSEAGFDDACRLQPMFKPSS